MKIEYLMNMKFCISVGLLFSLTLHFFLIVGLLRGYPGIINNEVWKWGGRTQFPNNKTDKSNVSNFERIKFSDKLSIGKIIYPDIVLFRENEKIKKIKKKIIPQISLKSILKQVEKFPESLDQEEVSNIKFSGKVGELITLLAPAKIKNELPKEGRLNLNFNELKQFRNSLDEFLSERWEVPIHLRGSNYSVFVQFEIKKNGRLLTWNIEKSSNYVLEKTLSNLLKNLQFLPSLPESYPEDSYKFGIKFSSENLK